jgi:lysosomal acid lipase/cholesteryl ester hydrolase
MDDVAKHDVPTAIHYILSHTPRNSKLTYIGFSQGTAVAFASFSHNQALSERVSLFVALAPATLATGL